MRDDSGEGEGVRRIGRYIFNAMPLLPPLLLVTTAVALRHRVEWSALQVICFVILALATPLCVTGWLIIRHEQKLARLEADRIQNRICLACGYDLRATPDRCPECGTIPTKVKA
jgi:uncharacterized paraquat-inducible protein A